MWQAFLNVSGKKTLISTTPAFLLIWLEGHDKCELFALLADSNMEYYSDNHSEIEFSNIK